MNYQIERLHIEQYILSCFINQNRCNELDQLEYREFELPYNLFKANITNKLCAKAIYNIQKEQGPIDDQTILCYIEKHIEINQVEWLELVGNLWSTYDTMITYLNRLKKIDKEESKMMKLDEI